MGWSEKYKKSINCDNPKGFSQRAHCQGRKKKMNEAKEKQDHEVSMAKTQVKKSIDNLQKVARVLAKKTDADNLPAWVQAKLTDTEHNTSAAADYMGEEKKKCGEGQYWCRTDEKCKKIPKGHHVMGNGDLMKDSEHEEGGDVSEEYLAEKKKRGGTLHNWFGKSKSKDGKPGWVQSDGSPCANEEGETKTPKCYSSRRLAGLKKTKEGRKKIRSADARKSRKDPGQQQKSGGAAPTMVRTFTDKKDYKKHKSGDYREGFEMQEARDIKGKGSGKKDACYHKVKSRYSVWPSAYASGALVKCRKVGAANWGTKSESFQYSNWRDDFKALEIETIDLIKPEPLVTEGMGKIALGIAAVSAAPYLVKKLFSKKATDSVNKARKELHINGNPLGAGARGLDKQSFEPEGQVVSEGDTPRGKKPSVGMTITDDMTKVQPSPKQQMRARVRSAGAKYGKPAFEKEMPQFTTEAKKCWKGYEKKGTQKLFGKTYNRCVKKEGFSNWREELAEGAAWTKKAGKNPKGGLNEKGRKSYERENPGSDLKAPSKKVGNKRRASFCARMKGMKKKLTSKKTANDPDSRINKSLRAWNC